jgi:hypothetical protein
MPSLFVPSSPAPPLQALHDRAAESARETRGHLVSLATGSLALFFIALTGKADPPLTDAQRLVVMLAIAALGAAIFSGVWSAYADAHWSYYWAKQVEAENAANADGAKAMQVEAGKWHWHKRWTEKSTMSLFLLGIALSAGYMVMRV